MKKSLVFIHKGEPRVSTWEMSKKFNVEHRNIKGLINRHKKRLEKHGVVTSMCNEKGKKKSGGQLAEYYLNDIQAIFLVTLFKNTENVVKWKEWLTLEFLKYRKMIATLAMNKKNAIWLENRRNGIVERREETDTIKMFVEYAESQGSKNASKYYMAITKMENQSLFHLDFLQQEFPNVREVVNAYCLDNLKMADRIVGNSIKEGLGKSLPYKEIFQLAKDRVNLYAKAIGKVPLVVALEPGKLV